MRNDTKLAGMRDAMRKGEWEEAIRIASRFQRLGSQAEEIQRAANAISDPRTYEQLGYDLNELRAKGIAALKERFNKSWEEARKGTQSSKDSKMKDE